MKHTLRNLISLYYFDISPRKGLIVLSYLEPIILICICLLAYMSRLYSLLMYGSIVHEFDPHFNYRTTDFLVKKGFYQLNNWFDETSWYPLGREIGATMFTGMMVTAQVIHSLLHSVGMPVRVSDVCVFVAPIFSMVSSLVTYSIGKELRGKPTGFFSAILISIIPAYMSRSTGGSFDNEGIAIACMLLTFFFWIKAIKYGSVFYSVLSAIFYFYMASSWGGYIFVINLIPIHVLVIMLLGRFTTIHYVAYSTFYVLGTILSMQIPFVGPQPVNSSEHLGAFGVFGLCQLLAFYYWLKSRMQKKSLYTLVKTSLFVSAALAVVVTSVLLILGKITPWTGRFYSIFDPSYAIDHIPIIASVAEHQPTTWASFYVNFHNLLFFFPVGCYYLIKRNDDLSIFSVLFGITTIYFSGIMVRLILVLSPIFCIIASVGLVEVLRTLVKIYMRYNKGNGKYSKSDYYLASGLLCFLVVLYVNPISNHSLKMAHYDFSNPMICVPTGSYDGYNHFIIDDYREAYTWLRQNTHPTAKIMSWWDYGYQLSVLSNRTILVDNNTWNNTHISLVGQAMASNESISYAIMDELDVDYVLIVFGGLVGYSSDDINKFLWMVRIGSNTPRGKHINEMDYFTANREYKVDDKATETMRNSMMYRMSFYRFAEVNPQEGSIDRVRNQEIPFTEKEFNVLDEAFTSRNWMVRIFRVKDRNLRGHGMFIKQE